MSMKLNCFPLFLFSLLLALGMGIHPAQPVLAQTETPPGPWAEVLGPDGSINFDNLTDLGSVNVQDLDWMNFSFPTIGEFQLTANFHRYLTPSGNIVVLPDAPTLFFMLMNPQESGLEQMMAGMGIDPENGITIGLSGQMYQDFLAGYVNWEDFAGTEFENPQDYFAALTNGDLDNWSWIIGMSPEDMVEALANGDITQLQYSLLQSMDLQNFNADLLTIMNDPQNGGTGWRYLALLLYSPGSMDCDDIPGGCPENLCLLAPQICTDSFCEQHPELCVGSLASCPAATVTIGRPTLNIFPIAPDSPLVVGQDPEKRGADIQVEVTIPPTIHEYYVPVPVYEDVQRCIPPDGEINPVLDCKTNESLADNNGTLKNVRELVRIDCEHHVDPYAEQIAGVNASAQLTQASQEWIEQDLSAYYYGAQVLQESFNLIPGLGAAHVGCDPGNVCHATAMITRVQLRDPGLFSLGLTVQTAGTPVTSGRVLNGSGQVEVFFLSVRLIEAGSY